MMLALFSCRPKVTNELENQDCWRKTLAQLVEQSCRNYICFPIMAAYGCPAKQAMKGL
jgi:hypothetical protein